MASCTIIILGVTGDLTRRKLIPAIYRLLAGGKLDDFALVGAAIDDVGPDEVLAGARQYLRSVDEDVWQRLASRTYYQQLDFLEAGDFVKLAGLVDRVEEEHDLSGSRLIYMAASPDYFCAITHGIAATGIAQRRGAGETLWHRIVYEKPFGHDLASAHEINDCIADQFHEAQVYRIDHYLTKELVSNIALVRFTNIVFEPLWNRHYIDQVQIVLSEEVCIEGRGAYYDAYGALRDVVQNHMLELLALVAMESPEKLTGRFIQEERAKVLRRTRAVDGVLGQYAGYRDETGVPLDSNTETFALLRLEVDNPRWEGVPFYLKTGKCLEATESAIHIRFKPTDCLLARNCPVASNWLTIRVAPDAAFILSLNAKKVGHAEELAPIAMEFCHSCAYGPLTPEAYEVLLEEVMKGERTATVRFDEIEYAWQIIDQVRNMDLPLHQYVRDAEGPEQALAFANKYGIRWRS